MRKIPTLEKTTESNFLGQVILIGKRQTSTGVEKDKSSAGALGWKGGGRGLPKALQLLQSTLWYLNHTHMWV